MPWRFIRRQLGRHRVRFALTVASLAVAIFLLCLLRSLVVTLDAGVRAAATHRLFVQSAVSLFVNLPESYEGKIRGVEGVEECAKMQWFGGHYREPANFFAQFGVDPENYLEIYPEIQIIEGSRENFLRSRNHCLVGYQTAERYGFQVGQTVPILGTIFQQVDGSSWNFVVAGIYRADSANVDNSNLLFHFDLLSEALASKSATGPPGTGVYVLRCRPESDPVQVMADIDRLFEGGPQRVQSTTEAQFQAQFVSMIGNVPFFVSSIGGGVLAAIVLAVLNTMLLYGREQTRDIGILKALGFGDRSVFGVLLAQSLLLVTTGGALGIGFALASATSVQSLLGTTFPGYEVTGGVLTEAVALTLGIGLLAGLAPAWRASRLRVVETLRRGA